MKLHIYGETHIENYELILINNAIITHDIMKYYIGLSKLENEVRTFYKKLIDNLDSRNDLLIEGEHEEPKLLNILKRRGLSTEPFNNIIQLGYPSSNWKKIIQEHSINNTESNAFLICGADHVNELLEINNNEITIIETRIMTLRKQEILGINY